LTLSDIAAAAVEADQRLRLAGVDPDRLVVRSMPFGELIDGVSRRRFTPPIPNSDIAYGLAHCVKVVAALSRLERR
jgi:hypothetical protein